MGHNEAGFGVAYGGDEDRFLSDMADGLAELSARWPQVADLAMMLHERVCGLMEEPRTECGDCGDSLTDDGNGYVHRDDKTPACHSRTMASARRVRQGRPEVGQ